MEGKVDSGVEMVGRVRENIPISDLSSGQGLDSTTVILLFSLCQFPSATAHLSIGVRK